MGKNLFRFIPLSGALGVEIRGAKLAQLSDDELAALRALWLEHLVLFFPDQHLTPEEQRSFGQRFGELDVYPSVVPRAKRSEEHPEIIMLGSEGGDRIDVFHTDITASPTPPMGSVLMAKVVPPSGGDTIFTNQYLAYEELSEPFRNLLDGLTAIHSGRLIGFPQLQTEHPVVRIHPETGRRSLFVNRSYVSHIPQLSRPESRALLEYLYTWSEQPQFQVRYRWSAGAVALWDNRCTQHCAVNDYPNEAVRIMQRVTLRGDKPAGEPARYPAYMPPRRGSSTEVYFRRPQRPQAATGS